VIFEEMISFVQSLTIFFAYLFVQCSPDVARVHRDTQRAAGGSQGGKHARTQPKGKDGGGEGRGGASKGRTASARRKLLAQGHTRGLLQNHNHLGHHGESKVNHARMPSSPSLLFSSRTPQFSLPPTRHILSTTTNFPSQSPLLSPSSPGNFVPVSCLALQNPPSKPSPSDKALVHASSIGSVTHIDYWSESPSCTLPNLQRNAINTSPVNTTARERQMAIGIDALNLPGGGQKWEKALLWAQSEREIKAAIGVEMAHGEKGASRAEVRRSLSEFSVFSPAAEMPGNTVLNC